MKVQSDDRVKIVDGTWAGSFGTVEYASDRSGLVRVVVDNWLAGGKPVVLSLGCDQVVIQHSPERGFFMEVPREGR